MKRGDRWMAAVTMAGAAMLIAGALIQQQRQYNEGRPLEAEIVLDGRVVETLPLTGPPREIKVDSAGTYPPTVRTGPVCARAGSDARAPARYVCRTASW